MKIEEIKSLVASTGYDFLREDPRLDKNIILLTVAGSHAYGTEHDGSDLDIRGAAVNSRRNILTMQDFEHVRDNNTDTTIYSFDKLVRMLCAGNPNVIELLGLKPEHYLVQTAVGKELLARKEMFLSKRIADTFSGFAKSQFVQAGACGSDGRLDNAYKHCMHGVRALCMGIEILETGNIRTYRSAEERAFLKNIRSGCEQSAYNAEPTDALWEFIKELQNRLESVRYKTSLPNSANVTLAEDFIMEVNGEICCC